MVSKNEIRLITSLQQKKYRNKHKLFVVEGVKSVKEFIQAKYKIYKIYQQSDISIDIEQQFLHKVSETDMKKISNLKTPPGILGVFEIPQKPILEVTDLQIVLDGVKDPGNLGTIIRLCDWFGVTQIVCSLDTVDCYNPKVVQATMGSLRNVNVVYTELLPFLLHTSLPVYISKMDAENVYTQPLEEKAVIVMGNEAHGVSKSIQKIASKTISIPRYGKKSKAESLNVATATAVLLSEFRRRLSVTY